MEVYSVLFYLQKAKERQTAKVGRELAQMKLLVMVIHSDPQEMLEAIDDAQYNAEDSYDSEIGDIRKLKRFGGNDGK